MASDAQIAAKRRNAAKSTGPRTDHGKDAVARNALRHGLRAEKVVTFDETNSDFQAFLDEQRAAFAPADAIEEQLVERVAFCAWRLRRVYRIEADLIDGCRASEYRGLEELDIAAVFDACPDEMTTLSRYETALDRALNRALMMLERRQARRGGEFVPAPIALALAGGDAADLAGPAAATTENFRTKPIWRGESETELQSPAALTSPDGWE